MRQFNLAEIFLVTAGVAVSCALGRALFDALLTGPLIGGAILLAAALPTMVAAFVLCSGRSGWRQWGILLAWAGSITLALSPVVSFAHNELGLLAQSIGRWTTLAPLSLRTIAIAAAYTMAVALAAGFNWRALARLGLRCQVRLRAALPLAADAIGSPARLTPPAAPR